MANLATIQDIELRLGITFPESKQGQINALLGDASAKIRSYTKQQFTYVENDVQVLRPVGATLRIPQTPVVKIHKIEAMSGYPDLPDFTLAAWVFDGIDKVQLWGSVDQIVNYPSWWYEFEGANTYRVTYDHGYIGSEGDSGVPDDVVAVCCAMVSRVTLSPTPIEGMVSERIGQYFYQLQQQGGSAGAIVRLNSDDKSSLDPYRKKATTIQLSSMS